MGHFCAPCRTARISIFSQYSVLGHERRRCAVAKG
jgi:hypothetical protein